MSQSYDDVYQVCTEERRKARKARPCGACREEIRVGDVYVRQAGLYDGEWDIFIRCLRCDRMYHLLDEKIRKSSGGFEHEGADPLLNCGHEYVELWGEAPPAELADLAFLTRDEAQKQLGRPA